jgi:hypothetical protein
VAYADPPDPSWIGGYWDNDDFDTVVAYIASTFAVVAKSDVDGTPCLVWVQGTDRTTLGFISSLFTDPGRPRAPPTASLPLC